MLKGGEILLFNSTVQCRFPRSCQTLRSVLLKSFYTGFRAKSSGMEVGMARYWNDLAKV